MARRSNAAPTPTDAELDILRVLWERGGSTVREVHDVVSTLREIGYTTVLKQMQVMHQKGLLTREERFKSHVYAPTQARSVTQRALVGQLLRQAFDGSARSLLQSALAGRRIDAAELDAIRALLDQVRTRERS